MDSNPAIASQKLQTYLLAIQNWFKKWRLNVNEPKSIHVTFTTRRETCLQEEDVKYLDRRLTWHTHFFAKRKQLKIIFTKMNWLLGRKSKLSTGNNLLMRKTIVK
jgi:hypothetical protein